MYYATYDFSRFQVKVADKQEGIGHYITFCYLPFLPSSIFILAKILLTLRAIAWSSNLVCLSLSALHKQRMKYEPVGCTQETYSVNINPF